MITGSISQIWKHPLSGTLGYWVLELEIKSRQYDFTAHPNPNYNSGLPQNPDLSLSGSQYSGQGGQ